MSAQGRHRLSLTLRDLSAAAAFGGMAISQQLSPAVLGAFAVALVVALFGRRPFARAPFLGAALLIASAALLALLVFQGVLDPVIGACSFAALLAVNRMLSERAPATDRQVHLASLLMISGGAALSGDLLFGAMLVLFTALAILSLTLGVVEQATGDSEGVPTAAVLKTAGRGALAVVLLGAVLFALFPRLSWNLAPPRSALAGGNPSTGFSDQVGLGGDGTLKRDLRVVMRVRLDPDPHREELDTYWVGRRYLDFDGRGWTTREPVSEPEASVTLSPGGRRTVLNAVELLPAFGAHTLIALDRPILFGGALVHRPSGTRPTLLTRTPGGEVRFAEHGVSYSYYAYSLAQADAVLSEVDRSRALHLPGGLDPRVSQLARSIAPEERDPERIAAAFERYLRQGYRYTLELGGDVADPLSDFLFVRRAGHCEHFATALAVLLRARGIPARIVTGFFGGVRVEEQYLLRAGDAHAWTEAWTGDRWLRLDATPPEARSAQASPWAERLARVWDQVDAFWRIRVVDYSIRDQAAALQRLFPNRHRGAPSPTRAAPRLGGWLSALAAGLGFFAFVWLVRTRPAPSRHREAIRLRERAERLLERSGRAPRPQEEWEERVRRLERERDPACASLAVLNRRYLEARFGRRALRRGEARGLLVGLAAALRSGARAH